MANAEGFRLVRCPNCLNILPEPHNVTAYKCGGCGTTLRAKICASNGQHVAAKQARQDSDSYSVATAASNGGAPPRNKEQGSESSFDADAPSTEHGSNGAGSGGSGNGDGTLAGQNVVVGHDAENKENHTVEQPTENSETCRVVSGHDDTERRLNASENKTVSSEMSKAAVGVQDPPEQKEAGRAAANKKGYLVRVLSRSCDLRSSRDSTDFHSARTSLQSKSFRASEPLQSKIMNTVDELKGDLSELFSNKPADDDGKPKAHQPPRRSKQDGRATRAAAITSSAPLAAYHPAAKHSGYVSRPSKSGQVAVAPRGLPSLRYRRHGVYPFHHSVRTEMRPCRHGHGCCHHSCQPPCYRPCKPPVMVVKRPPPPPPRNHCMPVLRGAPFVICSSCVSLVQLPAEFAVPTRGTRRLQCGSCSGVLSYSYRDPGARKKLQSPFGGDEYSTDEYEQAAGGGHSAAAGFFEQADPVSYSEEYGLSFGISHSTSTEDGQPPLYVSRNSSFNTADDERTGTRDGKLHRLMGYSSASEVLQHSPDLFESFGRRAADAGRTHVDGKGKGVCVAENDAGERDGGAVERSKARSGGWPVHGILKKGIHGLESLKLRS